ncbi:glycosyltransferase [Desulfosediminicola sp.]|uniref:glycosyltransferase n=1 Tax=Desulfosediminicola sp. TaxID=2886825 RepID=UPI003AF221D2
MEEYADGRSQAQAEELRALSLQITPIVLRSFSRNSYSRAFSQSSRKLNEILFEVAVARIRPSIVFSMSLFQGLHEDVSSGYRKLYWHAEHFCILYDLIPLMENNRYLRTRRALHWYHEKLELLLGSDRIMTISEFVGAQFCERFPSHREKLIIIHAGGRERFFDIGEPRTRSHGRAILYVGSIEPRKNIETLIRAFAAIPEDCRTTLTLRLVGRSKRKYRENLARLATSLGLVRGIDFLFVENATDDQVIKYYLESRLFVFPSVSEGFGLPVLEAMQLGVPVLAANATSIPEVLGCEKLLFPPLDFNILSKKIRHLLNDEIAYTKASSYCHNRSLSYRWEDVIGRVNLSQSTPTKNLQLTDQTQLETPALDLNFAESIDILMLAKYRKLVKFLKSNAVRLEETIDTLTCH